ncbi:cupin domain-containing protein [Miltoncostaea marina]|uniref:cupin domain-containing protein n=1 Tax=Miltoncostaea marina TaxID=2843215 RepID=UPI001C3E75E8|nr:cupin domain-containing protein [Miltoncostaea marina]
MQAIDLDRLDLMSIESPTDPTRRLRVAFPMSSATGTAASASVYFELDPGAHVGVHTDSAEEFLVIMEGSGLGLVGEETAPVHAGQVVLVPPMVRHDVTNTGDGPLRVFGTFAAPTVVSEFEEPVAPGGPQVFVIGASFPIALPLAEPALV